LLDPLITVTVVKRGLHILRCHHLPHDKQRLFRYWCSSAFSSVNTDRLV
jgi:hypothetical protein